MTKLETLSLVFLFFSLYSNFVFEIKSSEYKGLISSSNVFFLALYESYYYFSFFSFFSNQLIPIFHLCHLFLLPSKDIPLYFESNFLNFFFVFFSFVIYIFMTFRFSFFISSLSNALFCSLLNSIFLLSSFFLLFLAFSFLYTFYAFTPIDF